MKRIQNETEHSGFDASEYKSLESSFKDCNPSLYCRNKEAIKAAILNKYVKLLLSDDEINLIAAAGNKIEKIEGEDS